MITSVCINKTNGNVVTLSGSELRVWTVNGRLLASCSVTAMRRGSGPTCAVSTDCPDWQVLAARSGRIEYLCDRLGYAFVCGVIANSTRERLTTTVVLILRE